MLDSSLRGLTKLRDNVEKEEDASKLLELVKRLKHLEQIVSGKDGRTSISQSDYAI